MSEPSTIASHLRKATSPQTHTTEPNNITYAEAVRFEQPKVQKYSRAASLCSIVSLLFMSR